MLRIDCLSIFPEIISGALGHSIPSLAQEKGLLAVAHHDIRDYTTDKHQKVDDIPYGGGAGMVFKPEPVVAALSDLRGQDALVIHPSPAAPRLTQQDVIDLAAKPHLIFLASRYEGLDQRVIDHHVDLEFSLGDFVISGGELACAVMIDAIVRMLPGALGKAASFQEDSFYDGLLDHPHYTRPPVFEGHAVPEVLQQGHHEKIRLWRKEQALRRTLAFRPDLLANREQDKETRELLKKIRAGQD
ncbi:MAG: tRNA (guanosine(37)-N1)-methyltransferase TrmD [Acidobacteriota bacterium]|nr:tRNA (guanosine(37)-N1)-methyltransferase TrmD [Acidobacteriota bacterium]